MTSNPLEEELDVDELRLIELACKQSNIADNRNTTADEADPHMADASTASDMKIDPELSLRSKIYLILSISFPVMGSFILFQLSSFIILFFAGHLGHSSNKTTVFAGISMANMFVNVSWFSLLSGLSSAVETLASQNNGAKNYREVGIVLQRSVFILSLLIPPVLLLWYYVGSLLAMLGTDPAIGDVMREYLMVRAATMPIDVIGKSYSKYLSSLGETTPELYSQILGILSNFIVGWVLIRWRSGGVQSLAWTFVISTYISFFAMVWVSWLRPSVQRTIQPLTLEACSNVAEFVKLGLPGLIMLCAEWWAFELLTLFASQKGAEAVASQTIIIQMASLAFMIPFALGVAITTVVGNAIGAGEISLAREFSKLSVGCLVGFEMFISPCILLFGVSFVKIFTSDDLVIHIADRSIPILAVFTLVDGLAAVLAGVTRGAGMQHMGAFVNVPAYYLFGLPLAWYLCFKTTFGVVGLVLGIAIAPVLTNTCLLYLIFATDFVFHRQTYDLVLDSSTSAGERDVEFINMIAKFHEQVDEEA